LLQQQVAGPLAVFGIADEQRHDMSSFDITGNPAALRIALTRAARS